NSDISKRSDGSPFRSSTILSIHLKPAYITRRYQKIRLRTRGSSPALSAESLRHDAVPPARAVAKPTMNMLPGRSGRLVVDAARVPFRCRSRTTARWRYRCGFGALWLAGLLIFVRPVWSQGTANEVDHYTRHPVFRIPFKYDLSDRRLKQVQLFVSTDQG